MIGIVYAYAYYPVILCLLAKLFDRTAIPPVGSDDLPYISLLIAAHNEQAVIRQRIQNALALDYPQKRIEVLIASDGSTDQTGDVVQEYASQGVRLLNYPHAVGRRWC